MFLIDEVGYIGNKIISAVEADIPFLVERNSKPSGNKNSRNLIGSSVYWYIAQNKQMFKKCKSVFDLLSPTNSVIKWRRVQLMASSPSAAADKCAAVLLETRLRLAAEWWLGGEGETMTKLRGKSVIIYPWTISNINGFFAFTHTFEWCLCVNGKIKVLFFKCFSLKQDLLQS